MKPLIAILLLIVAVSAFGANPSYQAFRGSGGIGIISNPPNGTIIIDGSGISSPTGGVSAAVVTNIVLENGTKVSAGNNITVATNTTASNIVYTVGVNSNLLFNAAGSIYMIGSDANGNFGISNSTSGRWSMVNSNGVGDDWYMPGFVSMNDIRLRNPPGTGDFLAISSDGLVLRTNAQSGSSTQMVTAAIGTLAVSNSIIFFDNGSGDVLTFGPDLGTHAFGISNRTSGRWSMVLSNASGDDWYMPGFISMNDVRLRNAPGTGDFLAIDATGLVLRTNVTGGSSSSSDTNAVLTNLVGTVARNVTNVVSLSTSNATSKPLTNSYTSGVLTVFGLEGGSGVTIAPNGSNLVISSSASSVAPPISSVQFNSNGVMQGSAGFVFTNANVGIGTPSPTAVLTVSNTTATTPSFQVFASNNPVAVVAVTSNGNSGFGTASPAARVEVLGDGTSGSLVVKGAGSGSSGVVIWGSLNSAGNAIRMQGNSANGGPSSIYSDYGTTEGDLVLGAYSFRANQLYLSKTAGNVGIGTNSPLVKLDVAGGIRSHNVTASRMAAFHTDKTLTNGATTVALLDNFFAMGITNIVAADANTVIRTNAGSLSISNSASGGGISISAHTNTIPFVNAAGTGLTTIEAYSFGSLTNPGFGFVPKVGSAVQPHGYGGLMVYANDPMGLVTIGHPNPGSDFETYATAFVISNRFNSAGGYKNDMVKIEAVIVNGGNLQADSTMTRWRVWQAPIGGGPSTSSNDVAELTMGGVLILAGGMPTNNAAFTITTNDFALNTYYTNMAQRSWVTATISLTNILATDKSQVALYVDQDADGSWERQGFNVRLQGVALSSGSEQLAAFLQPGARFIYTNLTTGTATAGIEANSSQWVRQ